MRKMTNDSLLAFYVNQLENLDPKFHEPLVAVTWGRDIKLRPGITLANESTSFIRSSFAGAGTLTNSDNMPFISDEATAIPGVSVNGEKIVLPLRILAREVSFTAPELERSQLLGQPIDATKVNALNTLYQMNIDQMVYIGASSVGATGLVNSSLVTYGNVAQNAGATSTLWTAKTPDEILKDVNALLTSTWEASGFAVCPTDLLLPPAQFGYLSSTKVSTAGNMSILEYVKQNCISNTINGRPLDVKPVKWLKGRGAASTDRMVAYTNDVERVRFPMVPIRRENAYYQGIRFTSPYLWAFGEMEFVYPETVQYADGI